MYLNNCLNVERVKRSGMNPTIFRAYTITKSHYVTSYYCKDGRLYLLLFVKLQRKRGLS